MWKDATALLNPVLASFVQRPGLGPKEGKASEDETDNNVTSSILTSPLPMSATPSPTRPAFEADKEEDTTRPSQEIENRAPSTGIEGVDITRHSNINTFSTNASRRNDVGRIQQQQVRRRQGRGDRRVGGGINTNKAVVRNNYLPRSFPLRGRQKRLRRKEPTKMQPRRSSNSSMVLASKSLQNNLHGRYNSKRILR